MANFNLPAVPTTPEGGLAGFFRGTQYNYGIADAERQFRDSDLANQRLQNLYQNELLDNPMKEEERAKKIADAIYEKELINSGAKRRGFDAEVDSKVASTDGQKLLNRKNEIIIASDALTQAAAMPEQAQIGMWGELETKLKPLGVKFPQGGPTVENRQILKQMAQASTQTVSHLQKLEAQEQEGTIRSNLNIQEFGFRAGEGAKDRENRLEAARIQASAMANKPPTGTAYEQAVKSAKEKTNQGQPILASDILSIAGTMEKSDSKTESEIKTKLLNDLRPLNTKSPEVMERFVATFGISKEDLAKFKNPKGGFEVEALATHIAKEFTTGLSLSEAWKSTGGGKMPEEEWARINSMSKQAGDFIKKNGGVIPKTNNPGGSPTPAATSTKATPGEVPGDWNKFVNDAVASENKKGRQVTFAMAQKRLMELGYYPKGSKPSKSASSSVSIPSTDGMRTD